MARHPFGGDLAAWTFSVGTGNVATLAGGIAVTMWTAPTGGTQITDLAQDSGGLTVVDHVTSSDGTDGNIVGQIPQFWGPDGTNEMWAQAGTGSPRVLMVATDAGDAAAAASALAGSVSASLSAFTATAVRQTSDLSDVNLPSPATRVGGTFLSWDSGTQKFLLAAPAAAAGAVLLSPPPSGGVYVGNTAQPPDPSQGPSGNPWLLLVQPYSSTDNNPDALQFKTTASGGAKYKCFWVNGNGEVRAAPSQPNRIGFRAFENYEANGGGSTDVFASFSTNPTNSANREAVFAIYGTASAKPGWAESTRIVSGLSGVAVGTSYNGLSQLIFRGRRTSTGAPTTGTWLANDVVMDSAGVLYLCTAGGTPGTWVGGGGGGSNEAGPTSFVDITPGASMGHGTKHAATRLERGGDAVRLRGTLTASGAISSGATIATIPTTAHRPATTVTTIVRTTGSGAQLIINTDGTVVLQTTLSSGQSVWLDGITWDLV